MEYSDFRCLGGGNWTFTRNVTIHSVFYAFLGEFLAQITTFHKIPQIPHSLCEFPENHLKYVELGEKYRSGRERHLKRPKTDCVFIMFRLKV